LNRRQAEIQLESRVYAFTRTLAGARDARLLTSGAIAAVAKAHMFDVVVVMDPIGSIKIAKDSTFAMLLEAQRRGHRLWYVLPGGLWVRDGRAGATAAPLEVRDTYGDHYKLGATSHFELGSGTSS
jgi:glutathione synthase